MEGTLTWAAAIRLLGGWEIGRRGEGCQRPDLGRACMSWSRTDDNCWEEKRKLR